MFINWLYKIVGLTSIIALLLAIQFFLNQNIQGFVITIIITAGVNIILAVSLNLINGITGQFSLGHAGFMAIGAYTGASFSVFYAPKLNIPPELILPLALIVAAIFSGFAGLCVGLPSLRLRGDYLAIATLGFGEITRLIVTTIEKVGGATGFTGIPKLANIAWVYIMVIFCILMMRNICQSSLGRAMRAVRDDEIAAAASGINTTYTKVLAFIIAAAWAGVAGALLAHYSSIAHPETYNFLKSVMIVTMVVLGGLGSITGSIFSAVLITYIEESLRSAQDALYAALIIAAGIIYMQYLNYRESADITKNQQLRRLVIIASVSVVSLIILFVFGQNWLETNIQSLRYVLFAIILIILMLLRPTGIMGRKEFSLGFLKKYRANKT